MPGRDGTGPYGTGPGQGRGRGPCRTPAYSGNYDEKAFLESTIIRLESQLNMYKKRLEELK